MTSRKRFEIKKILADEELREKLIVPTIQATQLREGIETTLEQAKKAYRKVRDEQK